MLDKASVQNEFMKGFDCSQVVLMQQAERLDMEPETLARTAAAFGGGMFRGDTCGAVSGAMIALGLLYGHDRPGDAAAKEELKRKVAAFQRKFIERRGSTICRELIRFDFVKGAEEFAKAMDSGELMEFCPLLVLDALSILDALNT